MKRTSKRKTINRVIGAVTFIILAIFMVLVIATIREILLNEDQPPISEYDKSLSVEEPLETTNSSILALVEETKEYVDSFSMGGRVEEIDLRFSNNGENLKRFLIEFYEADSEIRGYIRVTEVICDIERQMITNTNFFYSKNILDEQEAAKEFEYELSEEEFSNVINNLHLESEKIRIENDISSIHFLFQAKKVNVDIYDSAGKWSGYEINYNDLK